jgi:citronellyl-CoA dehydrogenase
MQLTEQHEELRRTVARVVESEINPHVDEWEKEGVFPAHELFKKLGDLGLLGISKPEDYGGLGLDFSYDAILAEEIGAVRGGSVPMAIGVQVAMATPALARAGSDELRAEFLAPAITGEKVLSVAVSEPHAGSDVASIKTHAKIDGDDYVISGSKMWITNSTQADAYCVLCNTEDGHRHTNKSLIMVPRTAKGVSVSPRLDKLGMRSSDTAQVFFDEVRVPRRNLIGQEGGGFSLQMQQFQDERLWAALSILKGLELCIEETAAYTADRHAFGQPLLNNQVIQFRLAELQTEIEALRALSWHCVEEMTQGNDMTLYASMAKLKGGRLAREVGDACLQYWGGQGYMWDNVVSRLYRDMRLMSIGGGADEVMLGIIGKYKGWGARKRN